MRKTLKGPLECKRVPPYYSENQDVYHMCGNCTEGNNIEPKNRRSGTGGKRLCKRCESMSVRFKR